MWSIGMKNGFRTFPEYGDGSFAKKGLEKADVALNKLLDEHDAGIIGDEAMLQGLRKLAEKEPEFIDGHAHVGSALFNAGDFEGALAAAKAGLDLGRKAIPEGYEGMIKWDSLANRPFLRAAHVAVLALRKLGQQDEAMALMEEMMAWNPNDNQGIRFLIAEDKQAPSPEI
jgi:tetratricopeptide (TPR) repeat protein